MERDAVQRVQELMEQRQKLEDEIRSLKAVLESQGVGMDDPLVDKDDYPRSDVDIYAVRKARNKINCLGNDLCTIMKDIEAGLHEVHGIAREKKGLGQPFHIPQLQVVGQKPFLIVKSVTLGSPAKEAGLCNGDLVIQFGGISADNFGNLKSIGDLVQRSEGRELPLLIQRDGLQLSLSLTPHKWSGRGLLGCLVDVFGK